MIWSLTGTMSFEAGCTVNSITEEALPLIFEISVTCSELIVIAPVV